MARGFKIGGLCPSLWGGMHFAPVLLLPGSKLRLPQNNNCHSNNKSSETT